MANEQVKNLESILRQTSLKADKLGFFAGTLENPLKVTDAISIESKPGQFFVSMNKDVAKSMPGSYISPQQFIRELGGGERQLFVDNIASTHIGSDENPALRVQTTDKDFSLTVYHGSFNKRATDLTAIATQDLSDERTRASYQSNVFEIMKPILRKDSTFDVRIVEDCIASGDVIAGVKTALSKIRPDIRQGILRVDVAVATAQGILLLKKFAQDNGLKLHLNVGFMAFGLSAGQDVDGTEARAHANYITYPQEFLDMAPAAVKEKLEKYRSADGNLYVVGDMGDAAKSVSIDHDERHPWNYFRVDDHGTRNNSKVEEEAEIDGTMRLDVFLKRGGYLLKSMVDYMADKGITTKRQQMIFFGNRVWATDPYGYGVLINGMPLNKALVI